MADNCLQTNSSQFRSVQNSDTLGFYGQFGGVNARSREITPRCRTHRNVFQILLNLPEIRLYLLFFRLIMSHTEFRLVPNQSKNGKYNLSWVIDRSDTIADITKRLFLEDDMQTPGTSLKIGQVEFFVPKDAHCAMF